MFFLFFLVSGEAYKDEIDLSKYEKTVFSQNGEDGVIEKIFEIIGTSSKYYVEFGAYDGILCSNSRFLKEDLGWEGLLLDGGFENRELNLFKEFVTAENINDLFEKYQVPFDLDFLSIDIDFNDFYVWHALSNRYSPRLIVVEYNAAYLPHEDKVVKYSPFYLSDGTNYFGASILAFFNLARSKGYSLVYADKMGVNLFFIRDDLIDACNYHFKNINDVKKIYSYPKYGQGPRGGHPKDPLKRKFVKSIDFLGNAIQ